jgi:hypothetical protein
MGALEAAVCCRLRCHFQALQLGLRLGENPSGACLCHRDRRGAPREAIEVFLDRDDADAFLTECLRDEPDWKHVLQVVPIKLDERDISSN